MSHQPFVDLKGQWAEVQAELLPEIGEIMAVGSFIGGQRVDRFETAFASFCGAAHCVGVANGTDALHLALRAAGVEPGDEVITVPNTFVATVEAIRQCGARPVLVDVRPDTLLMDPQRLDSARTGRTRVVIPVHLYGLLADMEAIGGWSARTGIAIVEDAAQAHGARRGGCTAGGFGLAAGFSFYPSKNLGAAGDAGAVVTSDAKIADRVRLLRNHGEGERYVHDVEGYNSRLDTLQATVLMAKLARLADWNARRRALAAVYRSRLGSMPGVEPLAAPRDPDSHVYHLFVVRCARRAALREALAAAGIATGIHYPVAVHLQPAYHGLGYGRGSFPVAEAAAREVLSLPIYPHMTDTQVHRVCDAIEMFLERGAA
jgi:dTDP-4-amino-4,6-dideoxygalactose transaminase